MLVPFLPLNCKKASVISQSGTVSTNQSNTATTTQSGQGHAATVNQNNGSLFNRGAMAGASLADEPDENGAPVVQVLEAEPEPAVTTAPTAENEL